MPASPIGQLAVELGYLTPEALAECIALQQSEAGARGLGRILLERGHVTEVQLSYLLSARAGAVRDLEEYARAKTEDLVLKEALAAAQRVPEAGLTGCLRDQAGMERRGKSTRLALLLSARGLVDFPDMEEALAAIGDPRRVCPRCGALVDTLTDSYRATHTCRECGWTFAAPARATAADVDTKQRPVEQATKVKPEAPVTKADDAFRPEPTAPPPTPPTPGDCAEGTPFGKYLVIEEISRGGMGIVYKAVQSGVGRTVALKILLTDGAPSEAEVKRFQREATAAANLRHPNIVSVIDVGVEAGMPFMTMEYVNGPSLAGVLGRERLPIRRALEIVREVANGIDFAHKKGIIHRDIKPGNILLTAEGRPMITDFGLAKQLDSASHLTKTGTALGTPSYMAPEQAEGDVKNVDHRADVYGLGAVLYHLLTGAAPFKGETTVQTLYKVITQDAPRPSRVVPGIPAEVETICLKAMEKPIARRYQSAAEMAADIDRFLNGEGILAQRPSFTHRFARRLRRHRTLAITSALSLLLLGWIAHDKLEQGAHAAKQQAELAAEMQRISESQRRKFEREKRKIEDELQGMLAQQGGKTGPTGATPAAVENPTTPEELLQRGLKFREEKQPELAQRDFTSALAMAPKDGALAAALLTSRALCAITLGKPDAASADFDALLARADLPAASRLRALIYRGLLRLERDEFGGAVEDLTAALEIDGDNLSALLHRGIALVQLGRHDSALADLDRALAHSAAEPNDRLRVLIFRALARHGRGEYELAIADDNLALQLDPSSTQALTNRGIAYLCNGDLDRAVADLDRALALAPADPFAVPARELARRLQGALGTGAR